MFLEEVYWSSEEILGLFGRISWRRLQEVLEEGPGVLENISGVLDIILGVLERVLKILEETQMVFEKGQRSLKEVLEEVLESLRKLGGSWIRCQKSLRGF